MNSEAASNYNFSGDALQQRVATVEDRIAAVEKALRAAEFATLRAAISPRRGSGLGNLARLLEPRGFRIVYDSSGEREVIAPRIREPHGAAA